MRATTMARAALVLGLLLSAAAAAAYFPPRNGPWETRDPAALGMDAAALRKAAAFAQAHEYPEPRDLRVAILREFGREPGFRIAGPVRERGGPAGLILKNGYIVAQWGDVHRVDMTFSVTKSYLSAVAGLAWDAGLLPDLQAPVAALVWDGTFAGPHNGAVTWHHLLTQSSDWQGTLFGTPDWADRPPAEGTVDDWRNRPLHAPGTVFEYNDVRVNLLAYALLQVWRRPLPAVLKEHIMDPIGASPTWRWYGYDSAWVTVDGAKVNSVSGGGHFGGGLFISTLDQARYGLLMARRGRWQGRQLLSERWITLARTPSQAKPNYGYLWWLNRGGRRWKNLSDRLYYADGTGGNYIVVDDAHDLVVVTRWMDEDLAVLGQLLEIVEGALRRGASK